MLCKKDIYGFPRLIEQQITTEIQTSERDDLVLAGILSVLKGRGNRQSFTLSPEKANIALKKLSEMSKCSMPDTSKGVKFLRRGDNQFIIVPVDAVPNQSAVAYQFPENAAMFYDA